MDAETKRSIRRMAVASIDEVEALLVHGNALGGRSLSQLIAEYIERGPYNSIRNDLIRHLGRCLVAVIEMDTKILMRAKLDSSWKP